MAQITEAVYMNGVLKPKDELALHEAQRVRLIIEPLDDQIDHGDRSTAVERLRAGIEAMQFFSGGAFPSRDELHDRS